MKKLGRKTSRLHVRPLELKDFENWKTAHLSMSKPRNTWDVAPRPPKELNRSQFKKLLSSQARQRRLDQFYDFGVFDRQNNLVGMVALMEVSRGVSHSAFLGYRIFNAYWGLGYGKEAVHSALTIGFRKLKLHRIEAGIEPGNNRSIRLAKSLGMRHEGLKKRAIYLRKKWVDLLMYTLTTEDVGLKFSTARLKLRPR